MITATAFARSSTSFWRSVAPLLETAIRGINELASVKFADPVRTETAVEKRGEISTCSMKVLSSLPGFGTAVPRPDLLKACGETSVALGYEFSRFELFEMSLLVENLGVFFDKHYAPNDVSFAVEIRGCGIIDACEADAFALKDLLDVKAVKRQYRGSDIQQLLTYSALMVSAGMKIPTRIGIINPRRGTYGLIGLEDLSRRIAGVSATELLAEVIECASDPERY